MSAIQNDTISSSVLATMNGNTTAKAGTSASTAAGAQDRFMTLLVTQMKNQDPLNPMDNAQVTSQMAQLSTVTGIEKLNTTLESLVSGTQSNQLLQASNMIGHTVLTAGDHLALNSSKGVLAFELPSSADNVKVSIVDSGGNTLRTLSLGSKTAGITSLPWDGKTDTGTVATDGDYRFKVEATLAGKNVAASALSYDAVASISSSATAGVQLNLSRLGTIGMNVVKEVY
ncbi:MAG: flagellar hook assembly protein FlgD [Methylophilaceae bacterium]|nr:flagellar hook assembly protein FlgD [Methylophilaceae bacterium]